MADAGYNKTLGIQRGSDGQLELSGRGEVSNLFGYIHPCAIISLAEAASGQYLIDNLGVDIDSMSPVIRTMSVKVGKPAKERARAVCTVDEAQSNEFRDNLVNKGRSRLAMEVKVINEENKESMVASFDWMVMKVK